MCYDIVAGVWLSLAQAPWPNPDPARLGHPYDDPQPPEAPAELVVVIEIPAGSAVKYEIDKATGRVFVDRFQSMPVEAPANYGSIPRSLAPDGDPLDAVVLSRLPLHPGAFVRVRPVGVMKTLDDGQPDDKILAVPVSAVDPTYDPVTDAGGIPPMERERIGAYFRVYKQLPAGKEGKVLEVRGAAAAREAVTEAFARYRTAQKPGARKGN
jgi:inorganic pyrophosphatase